MTIKTPFFTYDDLAQLPDDGKRCELADETPSPVHSPRRSWLRWSDFSL